jgi:hypothetical protein
MLLKRMVLAKGEWEDSATQRITISPSSDQRKGTLEVIPEFPTVTDTEAST